MQCGVPEDILNGDVTFSDVTLGSVATYTCDGQYETADGQEGGRSVCTDSKTWSPPAPVCSCQSHSLL